MNRISFMPDTELLNGLRQDIITDIKTVVLTGIVIQAEDWTCRPNCPVSADLN
jgi:hypothetical protein